MTVTDALLALPFAFFAARVAPRPLQAWLFVVVLIPLWSSYLVRVYAWRLILAKDGILNWALRQLGARLAQVAYSNWSVWIVFSLHLAAVHDPSGLDGDRTRPGLFLEASARSRRPRLGDVPARPVPPDPAGHRGGLDLHLLADARRLHHVRRSSAAPASEFIGNVVYQKVGGANNVPFAAAFATVPLAVMAIYLRDRQTAGSVRGPVRRAQHDRVAAWTMLVLLFLSCRSRSSSSTRSTRPMSRAGRCTAFHEVVLLGLPQRGNALSRLWLSIRAGLISRVIAIVLGSMAAFAVHRFRFFGREACRSSSSCRSRCRESSPGWR